MLSWALGTGTAGSARCNECWGYGAGCGGAARITIRVDRRVEPAGEVAEKASHTETCVGAIGDRRPALERRPIPVGNARYARMMALTGSALFL